MGYIYKMTNKLNNKVYIGQTQTTVQERVRKHFSKAKHEPHLTGVDAAIRKYGEDNFLVETICECQNSELDELEKFYIAKYNSYNSPVGYNLTPGGQDGACMRLNLKPEEVISVYQKLKHVKLTAEYFHCCDKVISRILHENNITIYKPGRVENILGKGTPFKEGERTKAVYIVELDKSFGSLKECSQWLIDNGYSKANSMEMARKSLSRCLNGERNSYCKLHFKYI